MTEADGPDQARPARRDVLRGLAVGAGLTGFGAVLGGTAVALNHRGDDRAGPAPSAQPGAPVDPYGAHQAGMDRPATPQRHGLVAVFDTEARAPDALRALLAEIGAAIRVIITATVPELPDGPGDLTLTVGLGPAAVTGLYGKDAPGAASLPTFDSDVALAEASIGGDVLVAAYSSDPNSVAAAITAVRARVPGLKPRWSQRGFRPPGTGTIVRNPLGFHDGIVVPGSAKELNENVWIAEEPLVGGTICVIRRIVLDTAAFEAKDIARQEEIIGRRRSDGAPLSGGGPTGDVDLLAKNPTGAFITPAHAHARAAHPSFTGSKLMLRRGYAFDNGGGNAGLMFICFQQDLRTFVQTQLRMEEVDDLLEYMTVTASASFLILPGFTADSALGA